MCICRAGINRKKWQTLSVCSSFSSSFKVNRGKARYSTKEFIRCLWFCYCLCLAIYEKRTWLGAKHACGRCTTFVTVGVDIPLVLQHQRLGLPSEDSRSPSLGQNPSQEFSPRGFLGRLLASCDWRFSKSADLHLLTNLTCWPDHFPHCSWPCGTFLTHRGTLASLLCSLLPSISGITLSLFDNDLVVFDK